MTAPSLPPWESHEQQLRLDWERTHPNIPWNDVRLGYRYGWESARNPLYASRSWDDAERDLRRDWPSWQARQPEQINQKFHQGWDELQASIRIGWEQAWGEVSTTA